jgi:hypothetical protein
MRRKEVEHSSGLVIPRCSALKAVKLLPNGTLKIYPGYSHGMLTVNADLLVFVTG